MKTIEKKTMQAVALLQSFAQNAGEVVELAYSGGKDSEICRFLCEFAEIPYRAIYKNTTIDQPGTIAYCRARNVEIVQPKMSFFELLERQGMPSRFRRFCCTIMKEYPILDNVIMGVRRDESRARAQHYSEPTECRAYYRPKHVVQACYPILDWSLQDELEFINLHHVHLHPFYYDPDGTLHLERRVGCLACPMQNLPRRRAVYKQFPQLAKRTIKALDKWLDLRTSQGKVRPYADGTEYFYRELFFRTQQDWHNRLADLFPEERPIDILRACFGDKIE